MTTTPVAKRLTIFEGPTGSGKTTLAREFARETAALYIHCGPEKLSEASFPRYMAEAMLPALLGHQDVVMDRCWLSEEPYGRAVRNGADRIGPVYKRILERLAARCATLIIRCMPPWERVLRNWKNSSVTDHQKRHVYDVYSGIHTDLPMITFDYTIDDLDVLKAPTSGVKLHPFDTLRTIPHWSGRATAGRIGAVTVVVVADPPLLRDGEMWWRFPGVSFRQDSAEAKLANLMNAHQIDERRLLWASSHDDLGFLNYKANDIGFGKVPMKKEWRFLALGAEAASALRLHHINARTFDAPSFWFDIRGPAAAHPFLKEVSDDKGSSRDEESV